LLLQANTFTFAGYETTANALAFALWCISTHPEAEAALLQEAAAATQPFHTYSRDLEQQVGDTLSQLARLLFIPCMYCSTLPWCDVLAGWLHARLTVQHRAAVPTNDISPACCAAFALQFPYTCAVVSEALRLYPPGPPPSGRCLLMGPRCSWDAMPCPQAAACLWPAT
jgi:cytochrome P450